MIRHLLHSARSAGIWWWPPITLLIGAVIGASAGLAATAFREDGFRSTGEVVFVIAPGRLPAPATWTQHIENRLSVLDSRAVASRAAQALGPGYTTVGVEDMTTTKRIPDRDTVRITGVAGSPEESAAVVNALIDAFSEAVADLIQTNTTARYDVWVKALGNIAALEEAIAAGQTDDLSAMLDEARLEAERLEAAYLVAAAGGWSLLEQTPADPGESERTIDPVRDSAGAAVIGLLSALSLLWWRRARPAAGSRSGDPTSG